MRGQRSERKVRRKREKGKENLRNEVSEKKGT